MADQGTRIEPKSLADFNATMKRFAEKVKTDVEMITREQVRLMCRDAMTFTPPMTKGGGNGLSVAAHKAGKNKLGNDVRRIFIPQDSPVKGRSVFLRQVINAVKGDDRQTFLAISQTIDESKVAGLSPIMRKIMEDTDWQRSMAKAKNYLSKTNIFGTGKVAGVADNMMAIHDQAKGAVGGRWPRGQRYKGPQYFAMTSVALADYIATRQAKVGRVKAGWSVAQSLVPLPVNKRGVVYNRGVYNAPWVDANRSPVGQFSATRSGGSVAMTVANIIGNINGVADEADTKNIVYGNRVKQMQITIDKHIKPTIEDANRGAK